MGHANTVAETGGFDNGKGNEQPQSLIKKLSVDDVLDSSRQIQNTNASHRETHFVDICFQKLHTFTLRI